MTVIEKLINNSQIQVAILTTFVAIVSSMISWFARGKRDSNKRKLDNNRKLFDEKKLVYVKAISFMEEYVAATRQQTPFLNVEGMRSNNTKLELVAPSELNDKYNSVLQLANVWRESFNKIQIPMHPWEFDGKEYFYIKTGDMTSLDREERMKKEEERKKVVDNIYSKFVSEFKTLKKLIKEDLDSLQSKL